MIEQRGRLGFSEEAGFFVFVPQSGGGKKLESNDAAQLGVFGLVDDTHPAFTELGGDLVMRDGLADHWVGRFVLRG